jgi:hypothetical protein
MSNPPTAMPSSLSWFSAPTNRALQPAMPSAPTSRALDEFDELDDQLREIEHRAQGLTEQLGVASAARRSRRVRVTVIPLTLGIAFGLAGGLLYTLFNKISLGSALGVILLVTNVPLTLLSAPSNDARAAVGYSVFYCVLLFVAAFGNLQSARQLTDALDATPVCGMRYQLGVRLLIFATYTVTHLLATAVLLSRLAQHAASRSSACVALGWLRPITTRQLLLSIWRTFGIVYSVNLSGWVFYLLAYCWVMPAFVSMTVFAEVLAFAVCGVPTVGFCLRYVTQTPVRRPLA